MVFTDKFQNSSCIRVALQLPPCSLSQSLRLDKSQSHLHEEAEASALRRTLKNSSNAETCRAHWCCSHPTEALSGKLTDHATNSPCKTQPECGDFILCSIKEPRLQWQRPHRHVRNTGRLKGLSQPIYVEDPGGVKGRGRDQTMHFLMCFPFPLHLGFTSAGKIKAEVWKLLSQPMSVGPQRGCHSAGARGQSLVLRQSWAAGETLQGGDRPDTATPDTGRRHWAAGTAGSPA